jgi:hypothetical protein
LDIVGDCNWILLIVQLNKFSGTAEEEDVDENEDCEGCGAGGREERGRTGGGGGGGGMIVGKAFKIFTAGMSILLKSFITIPTPQFKIITYL